MFLFLIQSHLLTISYHSIHSLFVGSLFHNKLILDLKIIVSLNIGISLIRDVVPLISLLIVSTVWGWFFLHKCLICTCWMRGMHLRVHIKWGLITFIWGLYLMRVISRSGNVPLTFTSTGICAFRLNKFRFSNKTFKFAWLLFKNLLWDLSFLALLFIQRVRSWVST